MLKQLQGPKGTGGASYDGEFYEADENGVVEVPAEAVADLLSHGWSTSIQVEAVDETKRLTEEIKELRKALKADPENAELKGKLDATVDKLKALKNG